MAKPTPTGKPARFRRDAGFTYLSLIILLAIVGLVCATTLKLGALMRRSAAEQDLLNIGAEFSDALQSYAKATPPGQPTQPPSLKELLRDPRFPNARRHLRKIYVDPMTGKAEWGIVALAGTTGVLGVYSLSDAKAVKVANFPARFQAFEGKQYLSDWKFTATGELAPGQRPAPPGTKVPPAVPPGSTPPGSTPAPGAAAPGQAPMPVEPPQPPVQTAPEPEPEPEPEPAPEPPPPEPETTAR
ncbi:MAG: type II secretion system protein [Pseudomonadota bacterium]